MRFFWLLAVFFLLIPTSSGVVDVEDVSDEDRKILIQIARAVKRVKRNPFSDSDLREKESSETDDSTDKPETFHGSADDYCDKFEQHFSYFCVGETDQTDRNVYVVKKFCPSYKSACKHKAVTSSVSLTSWPTDPFAKQITVTSRPSRRRYKSEESDSDSAEDEEIYYAELRKRYPCKPDCDRRIFAHCTEECKCDYIYPIVQRFCNPPPMPMFLNTCRLWYHGCPKYERYHYSSQFVYSKAEKGKVLPGTPQQNPINPYNLPQPAPLTRNRALALAPIRRQKREADDDEFDLIIPPPVPPTAKKEITRSEEAISAPKSRAILHEYQESMKSREKKRRSRRKKLRRKRRLRQHNFVQKVTTQRPPTLKEVWRTLKQLNSLTSGPGAIGVKNSPATLKGGGNQGGLDGLLASVAEKSASEIATNPKQLTEDIIDAVKGDEPDFSKIKPRTFTSAASPTAIVEEQPEKDEKSKKASSGRAKALQGNIPILPSDASYGAASGGDDTFRAFDGLSDSRGLVHTPRSRSPFTKPGLWEPNPADPHSRDPANKYWYHPESVGVDWLNGQLQWGGHWAIPAAGTGGTAGMSAVHFPTIGSFLNIPDDYD